MTINKIDRNGSNQNGQMRTLLICHNGALLDQEGLARWMASISNLVGMIVLEETTGRGWKRIKREIKRVGSLRFFDVLAFRLYYKLFLSQHDAKWEERKLRELRSKYPDLNNVPVLHTHSPNTPESEEFIRQLAPDLMMARCKTLLKESVFSLPKIGTYVMHPGICPEYRNAHGCFWALANNDRGKVGMTLLKIDKGVDTGPVFGYYSYPFDELKESHIVVQARVVLDNLNEIEQKLNEIYHAEAEPLDTSGRDSLTWGQPWLTRYLMMRQRAKRERR